MCQNKAKKGWTPRMVIYTCRGVYILFFHVLCVLQMELSILYPIKKKSSEKNVFFRNFLSFKNFLLSKTCQKVQNLIIFLTIKFWSFEEKLSFLGKIFFWTKNFFWRKHFFDSIFFSCDREYLTLSVVNRVHGKIIYIRL